jgi:hypothetical protein
MKTSELAIELRNTAGRIASGSQEIDFARLTRLLIDSADRLERATKTGVSSIAYEHATKHCKPNALDFAFGAEWLAERIEEGSLK